MPIWELLEVIEKIRLLRLKAESRGLTEDERLKLQSYLNINVAVGL